MTLYNFNALPDNEQMQCWMQQGHYLMTRYVERFAVNLYAVDNFFVEVWYDPEPNRVDHLRSFSSVKALDDYLPHIRVEW